MIVLNETCSHRSHKAFSFPEERALLALLGRDNLLGRSRELKVWITKRCWRLLNHALSSGAVARSLYRALLHLRLRGRDRSVRSVSHVPA